MPGVHTFYDGSTVLQPLAEVLGFEVDKVNFVLCLFSSLPIAYVYREHFAAGKVSRQTRTLFPLLVGLIFSFFCFGRAVKHLLANALISYAIMYLAPPKNVHLLVFGFSMSYLLWIHSYRWIILTAYCVDITGPMMVAVQKITTLAYNLHDGLGQKEEDLTEVQKKEAISAVPSLLEYMSFIFNFQTMMSGPTNFYADYSAFLDGNHVQPNKQGKMPCSTEPALRKFVEAMFYFVVVATLGAWFKPEHILTQQYLDLPYYQWCFWWYFTIVLIRCNYYFAWIFADAVCTMSGFGFSGYSSEGEPVWELCTNVKPVQVEMAQSFKETLDGWNILTGGWFRRIAYDRTPEKYRTFATYLLSAVWHGVSVGYYLCFATAALFTLTGAKFRRCLRWRFTGDAAMKFGYDALTFFGTKLALAYATYPFVAMDAEPSFFVCRRVFFLGHVIAAACYFLLPVYFPPQRRANKSTANGSGTSDTAEISHKSSSSSSSDASISDSKKEL